MNSAHTDIKIIHSKMYDFVNVNNVRVKYVIVYDVQTYIIIIITVLISIKEKSKSKIQFF